MSSWSSRPWGAAGWGPAHLLPGTRQGRRGRSLPPKPLQHLPLQPPWLLRGEHALSRLDVVIQQEGWSWSCSCVPHMAPNTFVIPSVMRVTGASLLIASPGPESSGTDLGATVSLHRSSGQSLALLSHGSPQTADCIGACVGPTGQVGFPCSCRTRWCDLSSLPLASGCASPGVLPAFHMQPLPCPSPGLIPHDLN